RGVTRIIGLWLVAFAVSLAASFAALALSLGEPALQLIEITGCGLFAIFAALAWLLLDRLARPLDRLALDVEIIARENPAHRFGHGTRHWLGRLTERIEAVRARLTNVEIEGAKALAEAQKQGADQKRWLEAILLDLAEGIVVCNLQHQVLLYNQA